MRPTKRQPERERPHYRVQVWGKPGTARFLESVSSFFFEAQCAVEGWGEKSPGVTIAQLVSARKGIKSLSEKLIHSHVHNCIENAVSPKDAKKKLRELLIVLVRCVE